MIPFLHMKKVIIQFQHSMSAILSAAARQHFWDEVRDF